MIRPHVPVARGRRIKIKGTKVQEFNSRYPEEYDEAEGTIPFIQEYEAYFDKTLGTLIRVIKEKDDQGRYSS